MHVLIVHAHPEPASFNAGLTHAAVRALSGAGHTVEVSDLYAERFNPVGGRHDFTSVANPTLFHYQTEQELAARTGGFAEDIAREQRRVSAADLLILQFPLWWGAPPAVLKGWFERVLAYGFAYVDGRRFDTGLFQGRRALFSVTTGGTEARFATDGVYGPIEQVLWPVERLTLQYMGYEVEPPFVSYGAPRVGDAERAAYRDAWAARVVACAARPVRRTELDLAADLNTLGTNAWSRKA